MLNIVYDSLNSQPSIKATKEKIDRHLKDYNDTISEDDIRNITPAVINNGIIVDNGIIEIPERRSEPIMESKKITSQWNIIS